MKIPIMVFWNSWFTWERFKGQIFKCYETGLKLDYLVLTPSLWFMRACLKLIVKFIILRLGLSWVELCEPFYVDLLEINIILNGSDWIDMVVEQRVQYFRENFIWSLWDIITVYNFVDLYIVSPVVLVSMIERFLQLFINPDKNSNNNFKVN